MSIRPVKRLIKSKPTLEERQVTPKWIETRQTVSSGMLQETGQSVLGAVA